MIILHIVLLLAFIGYHYTFFSYSSYIFNYNKKPLLTGIFCGIVNLSFWVMYSTQLSLQYEFVATILYFLILYCEFRYLLKLKSLFALFISIAFCSNLFAKRFILIASLALYQDVALVDALSNPTMSLLSLILMFGVSISTINFARTRISRIYLDTILADNNNIRFLTVLLSILYVFMAVFSLSITSTLGGYNLAFLYIVVGVFSIIFFTIFIVFAYNLADLKLTAQSYSKTVIKNKEQSALIEQLHQASTTDDLTGLDSRDTAISAIDAYRESKQDFFLIFIDIDGLKYVNDNYGHNEGDFYIQSISQIVSDHFSLSIACRYGGDEIIVIGSYQNKSEVTSHIVKCFNEISNIKNKHQKQYPTSISYGLVYVTAQDQYTASELITIADKRMYEFKKANKKTRKTVAPH